MANLEAQMRPFRRTGPGFFGEPVQDTTGRVWILQAQRTDMMRELDRIREASRSFAKDAEQYAADLARLNARIDALNRRTPRTPRYSPDSMAEIEAQARRRGR
jgi:hypothetical protein